MSNFIQRQIWLPIDVNGDAEVTTLTSGAAGLMFKGGETRFNLALFDVMPVDADNVGTFLNHANLISFLLKIRSGSYAGALLLDSSSGATVTIDATCTEQEFFDKQKAPISVYCPSSITAIAAGSLYMTFTGATSDTPGQPDGFGRGRITVEDIGIGAADSAVPTGATAVSTDLFNAALAACVKYGLNPRGKTATFLSPSGAFGVTKGCDDNGEEIGSKETY